MKDGRATSSDKKSRSSKSTIVKLKKKPKKRPKLKRRNYARGSETERFLVHNLLDRGALLALKGGGSKSYSPDLGDEVKPKVDIVALFPGGSRRNRAQVVLVQSKPKAGSIPEAQRDALGLLAARTDACAYEGYRKSGAKYDVIFCSHSIEGWATQGFGCPVYEDRDS
jgi:hypothetical protein